MGPARFCLMISWLWNHIKDGGSCGWCRRYSGLSLGSIALLVWSSATGDAELKVTEAAPTDGFAGEEVASIEVDHYLLLMPQPAACSCLFFFEFGCTLINYHVGFSWIISSFYLHLNLNSNAVSCWISSISWTRKRLREGKPPLCSLTSFSL